jgi:hypothetical protein
MAVAPSADNTNGAAVTDVLSGKTFWGLRTDGTWGLKSGSVTAGSNVTGGNGLRTFNIPNGLYTGGKTATAGDVNLIPGNIKSGAAIFGVNGSVIQATGNAAAGDVLKGKSFSNAAGAGTGTMPNIGAVTITPGLTGKTIPAGYHNGSGTVSGDANLISGNIKSGAAIFGVSGAHAVVDTSSGTATAGDMLSGKIAYVNGAAVTGNVAAGSNVSGVNGNPAITIPDGLYSGGKSATAADANLIPGNIKGGTAIFGVNGSVIQATGNAVAGAVLSGDTFSNSSAAGLLGTMKRNGTLIIMPSTKQQKIPIGYHDGAGYVYGDQYLVPGNIKSGTSIFGVAGSVIPIGLVRLVAKTGQTTSYATGDDGYYQYGIDPAIDPAGAAGPYNTPPSGGTRFTDNGDGTVTDNLTALIWLKNANCTDTEGGKITFTNGALTWADALNWSNALASGFCKLNDNSTAGQWRLPNINELHSLGPTWPTGIPFTGVQSSQSSWYWSSSTYASNTVGAWFVDMSGGNVHLVNKADVDYVWPVRGGQ